MPALPVTVYAEAPGELYRDGLGQASLARLARTGLLDEMDADALLERLLTEHAVDVVDVAEDLPRAVLGGLLEREQRITVRRAVWEQPHRLEAEVLVRELTAHGRQMGLERRRGMLRALPARVLLGDERVLALALADTSLSDHLGTALEHLLRRSDDATQHRLVVESGVPLRVLARGLDRAFSPRDDDRLLAPRVVVHLAERLEADPMTTGRCAGTARLLLREVAAHFGRCELAQVDAHALLLAANRLREYSATDWRTVRSSALRASLEGRAGLAPRQVAALLELDAEDVLAGELPEDEVAQVVALVAQLPLCRHPVGGSWMSRVMRVLTTRALDDAGDEAAAQCLARTQLAAQLEPLRASQPWLAVRAGHTDLLVEALDSLQPDERGMALARLAKAGLLDDVGGDDLHDALALAGGLDDATAAAVLSRVPAEHLTAELVAATVDEAGRNVARVLLEDRLEDLDDAALLAVGRVVDDTGSASRWSDVLAQREWQDPALAAAAWETLGGFALRRILAGLERPLAEGVAERLVRSRPEDLTHVVVGLDGAEALRSHPWLADARDAVVAHVPAGKLLGGYPSHVGGRFVSRVLAERLGEDVVAWRTALSLLEDWGETLQALIDTVTALTGPEGG